MFAELSRISTSLPTIGVVVPCAHRPNAATMLATLTSATNDAVTTTLPLAGATKLPVLTFAEENAAIAVALTVSAVCEAGAYDDVARNWPDWLSGKPCPVDRLGTVTCPAA